MGRASDYNPELATVIIDELTEGKSLVRICAENESLPHRRTILRWMEADPDFATRCAHAREAGAEVDEDKIQSFADGCTEENAHSAKVKISTYQWLAAKKAPKKYGDQTRVQLTGKDGGPIETKHVDTLTDEQLAAIAAGGGAAPPQSETSSD